MVTTVSGGLSRCGVFSFCFPLPREQFVQAGSRDLRDAAEDVGEPELGIDLVEARGHDEGEHDGGPVRAAVGSSEQPGLSAQSHHPFILPMSAKSWKSITDGIPILVARSAFGAWSSGRRAYFLVCSARPASWSLSPLGCIRDLCRNDHGLATRRSGDASRVEAAVDRHSHCRRLPGRHWSRSGESP